MTWERAASPVHRVRPSGAQVRTTEAVVGWYLATQHLRSSDVGLLPMFCDPDLVGAFAVNRRDVERGEGGALFRLLVAVTMFQALRDALVLKILRGISAADVAELTSVRTLVRLGETCRCPHAGSPESLLSACDLTKDPATKRGTCASRPRTRCHLKRHTELLNRYGHFGKVPSSAAMVVQEHAGGDLGRLHERVCSTAQTPEERARLLSSTLCRIWRVDAKLASMFLSLVAVPDLGLDQPPWMPGVDWTRFVVIDRNVDGFLASIGYAGTASYAARSMFVRELARRIDLRRFRAGLRPFNPRLVQQAMFLFMSASNRKAARSDCSRIGPAQCLGCPRVLRVRCPVRPSTGASPDARHGLQGHDR